MALVAPRAGTPGAHEKAIGALGSMSYVLSGKIGPLTSKGAAVPALIRSSWLDVEAQVINVVHNRAGITLIHGRGLTNINGRQRLD